MITRFITEVKTTFNPFSPRAKPARLFLTLLPPNARANGMAISTQLLAKTSSEPSVLHVKFSKKAPSLPKSPLKSSPKACNPATTWPRSTRSKGGQKEASPFPWLTGSFPPNLVEDGKEMKLDCEKLSIKSIVEEVDRHSRFLQKQADLND